MPQTCFIWAPLNLSRTYLVGLSSLLAATTVWMACGPQASPSQTEVTAPRACETGTDCESGVCGVDGACQELGWPSADVGMGQGFDASGPDARAYDETWTEWGTRGTSAEHAEEVPGEFAYCSIENVRSDDLDGYYDDWYPESSEVEEPWPDEVGRCGDDLETLSWRLMNCERMSRGLEPLACDMRLVWASREHSSDMVRLSFFSHLDPRGTTPFDRLDQHNIEYTWAGENLAEYDDVFSAHLELMDSEPHRRNILNDRYTLAGVGVVGGGPTSLTLTSLLIRP